MSATFDNPATSMSKSASQGSGSGSDGVHHHAEHRSSSNSTTDMNNDTLSAPLPSHHRSDTGLSNGSNSNNSISTGSSSSSALFHPLTWEDTYQMPTSTCSTRSGPYGAVSPANHHHQHTTTAMNTLNAVSTADDSKHSSSVHTNQSNSNNNAAEGGALGAITTATTPSSSSTTAAHRPSNSRTRSSSSIRSSISSIGGSSVGTTPINNMTTILASHSHTAGSSPSGTTSSSNATTTTRHAGQEDEIESSLRQWRNHVFPSLKAGNYISPGQETPPTNGTSKSSSIHPIIEPILPSIFASSTNSSNSQVDAVVYNNGKEFLDDIILIRDSHQSRGDEIGETINGDERVAKTQSHVVEQDSKEEEENSQAGADTTADAEAQAPATKAHADSNAKEEEKASATGEDYENNWRLEMILGQTYDLINTYENAEGIWIALWSGNEKNGTRLLEFVAMKLPLRPLIISSPIPIALLPTALLQDRMQILLNSLLSLPNTRNNPSPFSLVMGPTRVVEAFLLHYDSSHLHDHPHHHAASPNANANGVVPLTGGIGASVADTASSFGAPAVPASAQVQEPQFEQTVHYSENSPYPLKLSHPKYTKAMQVAAESQAAATSATAAAAAVAASASSSKNNGTSATSTTTSAAEKGSTPAKVGINGVYGSGDTGLAPASARQSGKHATGAALQHQGIPHTGQQHSNRHIFHHSAAAGRTLKPLVHTRATKIPPAVSLSEGFVVRIADEKDDLRTLVTLFQAYSMTLDHSLEEHAARRALQKALSNKSVWIYHIYSQSLPGLSIIAGFLTTERSRAYSHSAHTTGKEKGKGKGSVAITAVFTEEVYRSRGVAESLVRAATRYHLVDLQYDYVSIYVDPRNETTCRVFSRVGFGIMDREVKEEIPVKLIKNALHQQWEEEKAHIEAEEAANDALLLAQTEKDEDVPLIRTSAVIREQEEKEQQALKQQKDGTGTGASAIPSAGAGGLLPTDEENEAALEAENGKPLCNSAEEWQVVSLKPRDQSHTMMTADARSRMRGHGKRDDPKRLSTEVPWH